MRINTYFIWLFAVPVKVEPIVLLEGPVGTGARSGPDLGTGRTRGWRNVLASFYVNAPVSKISKILLILPLAI